MAIPKEFTVHQNYHNLFNPQTTISFSLSHSSMVNLSIYDINGRLVNSLSNSGKLNAGIHSIKWDSKDSFGQSVTSGVYFYKLEVDGLSQTRKMLLLR